MNLARLTKNRLTIVWSGTSKIKPLSNEVLRYSRRKKRENRKNVFNNKKYINDEQE